MDDNSPQPLPKFAIIDPAAHQEDETVVQLWRKQSAELLIFKFQIRSLPDTARVCAGLVREHRVEQVLVNTAYAGALFGRRLQQELGEAVNVVPFYSRTGRL